jgi:hypothetical protein
MRTHQPGLGIFNVATPTPDYRKLAAQIVKQVWQSTRGSPAAPTAKPATVGFWRALSAFIQQFTVELSAMPKPTPKPVPRGPITEFWESLRAEIEIARGGTAAGPIGGEQSILQSLSPDQRVMLDRVPEPQRSQLIREFRGGVTPNGLSYLRTKVSLLAQGTGDQGEAQPAAVSSSAAEIVADEPAVWTPALDQ